MDLPTITVEDVAASYVVHERTVRRWVAQGLISHHRIGGLIRFSESDLAEFNQRSHRAAV